MRTSRRWCGGLSSRTLSLRDDSFAQQSHISSRSRSAPHRAGGRLKTRAWARATYTYDDSGALTNIAYSDSTPSVGIAFDRRGRTLTITQGTNTTTLLYNEAGLPVSEASTAGLLSGFTVTNIYDSLNRRIQSGILYNGSYVAVTTNSYDAASRLSFISDGTNSAIVSSIVMKPGRPGMLVSSFGSDL